MTNSTYEEIYNISSNTCDGDGICTLYTSLPHDSLEYLVTIKADERELIFLPSKKIIRLRELLFIHWYWKYQYSMK